MIEDGHVGGCVGPENYDRLHGGTCKGSGERRAENQAHLLPSLASLATSSPYWTESMCPLSLVSHNEPFSQGQEVIGFGPYATSL